MKNIIIIMVDAFRPKNMSLFGYEKETDRNMKEIAKENLLFTKFFSSSNATAPSLTSLFTAQFPDKTGIIHQFPYTTNEEIAKFEINKTFWLPEFLKEKGYETIAVDWIGTWFKDGFDYYKEREKTGIKKFLNNDIIKKILLNLPSWMYSFGKKIISARSSSKFSTPKETMDTAIMKIKESKKPFFVFAHFWDTHFPFSTINYSGSEKNDIEETLKKIKDNNIKDYFKKRIADIQLNSVEDMIGKYDAAIIEIDRQIGKLYDFLKKKKLWEDTILIIMGDHGTNLAGHNIYFSSSGLFDDTIHVPFIMHLPGFSGVIDEFAQNIDIAPTILNYLGFEKKGDGISFMQMIKENKPIRDKVFSWDGLAGNIKSVRTKKKKLILAENPACNLCKSEHHKKIEEYDLEKDPGEGENIYSGQSDLIESLDKKI